ncbi:hypothetical protein ESA_04190 [Cronobacter sakazakii ATCC BAA-894]|uniref:Uncharacterized protein n=1 Tax=Cronobacter sakazakii (strain ATCC BAA-894) TaxID=290339 RepID=A7MKQ3_CROS8|nr:hypothetical protein ESA_04190 [Cronobacter sakazakii ATCC BAA-894]
MRYQAAPITECGAHITAHPNSRQSLTLKKPVDRLKSQRYGYFAAEGT